MTPSWPSPHAVLGISNRWLMRKPGAHPGRLKAVGPASLFCRRLFKATLGAGLLGVGAVGWVWWALSAQADGIDLNIFLRQPEATRVFGERGQFLGVLPRGSTRRPLRADEIPPALIEATLQLEDRQFWHHGGVSWWSVAGAAKDGLFHGRRRGASTIEQQLVKLCGWGTPTRESVPEKLYRKLWEWALARRISRTYSKDEILAFYFNTIEFHPRAEGLRAASDWFFACEPKSMSVEQCALLAALLNNPAKLSPLRFPVPLKARRDLALRLLVKAGLLGPQNGARALALPIQVRTPALAGTPGSLLELVAREIARRELKLPPLGADVLVSVDFNLQETVESLTRRWLQKLDPRPAIGSPLQAAVLVIEARSGAVVAIVTGRNAPLDEFDRTRQAVLPPASTLKPFIVAAAYDRGLRPNARVDNRPISAGELGFGPATYAPRGRALQTEFVTPRQVLAYSLNWATLRLGDRLGLEAFGELLDRAALLESPLPAHPAVFLGSQGVRPAQLAAAYAAFCQEGVAAPSPHLVGALRDRHSGDLQECRPPAGPALFSPGTAGLVRSHLEAVLAIGTGSGARKMGLRVPRAWGKSGTSNDVKQAFFVGGNDTHIVCVALAYDRPRSIAPGRSAAQLALPLWCSVMNATWDSERAHTQSRPDQVAP